MAREARTQSATHKARRENVNEQLPWEEDREEQWGARQLNVGWEETGRTAASNSQGSQEDQEMELRKAV